MSSNTPSVDDGRGGSRSSTICTESVDLVYAQAIRSVESQHAHASSIDTKASFVLSAATLIIGFQGILGTIAGHNVSNPLWILPAFTAYGSVIWAVFQSYRVREFIDSTFEPDKMIAYFYHSSEFTKRQFIASLADIHWINASVIGKKVCWLRAAELLLLLQIITLGLGFLFDGHWSTILEWVN